MLQFFAKSSCNRSKFNVSVETPNSQRSAIVERQGDLVFTVRLLLPSQEGSGQRFTSEKTSAVAKVPPECDLLEPQLPQCVRDMAFWGLGSACDSVWPAACESAQQSSWPVTQHHHARCRRWVAAEDPQHPCQFGFDRIQENLFSSVFEARIPGSTAGQWPLLNGPGSRWPSQTQSEHRSGYRLVARLSEWRHSRSYILHHPG